MLEIGDRSVPLNGFREVCPIRPLTPTLTLPLILTLTLTSARPRSCYLTPTLTLSLTLSPTLTLPRFPSARSRSCSSSRQPTASNSIGTLALALGPLPYPDP